MTGMATRGAILDPALAERDRIVARLREQAPRLRARGISRLSAFDVVDLQDDLQVLLGRPPHFAFAAKLRPWLRQEILAEAIPIF